MRKKRDTIERASVEPRKIETSAPHAPRPEKVSTPGVDPAAITYDELSFRSKMKLNFADGRIARFLTGKSKAGEIFHAVIDVLPVPNIHEIIKAVVKDHQAADRVLGGFQLIKETWGRLDTVRTIATIIGAIILVMATRWTGIEPGVLLDVIKKLSTIV